MDKFIGCIVSLDCGETLGTYQGQVIAINPVEGSITIIQPYRNGIPFKSPQVTLRSQDIEQLTIVKSSGEAKQLIPVVNKKIQLLLNNSDSLSTDELKASASIPQALAPALSISSIFSHHGQLNNSKAKAQSGAHQDPMADSSVDGVGQIKANGGCQNEAQNFSASLCINSQMASLMSANLGHLSTADNKMSGRKRTSSASDVNCVLQSRRATTPRKADRQRQKNHDCFNDLEIFVDDFDFEKNLALFDKQAVFEEIEKGRENGTGGQNSRTNRSEQKYRCDENILQGTTKKTLQQIRFLDDCTRKDTHIRQYMTDNGLIVPSIPLELRERLFGLAENCGLSRVRMLEMAGRSSSEMILQLLGGNSRFDPRNSHQRPHVVVLCGSGLPAAVAVNCARHLATHSVAVTLFLSPSFDQSKEAEEELRLYRLTDGKFTFSLNELPSTVVDLIVSSPSLHDASDSTSELWNQSVSHWANQSKTRVLTIDPLVEGSLIESSWCLTWVLPLSYDDRCGQVYLCDLGIPQKLFKEVGIIYESPFAHKFIAPLHRS